jgi:hypothetical protein
VGRTVATVLLGALIAPTWFSVRVLVSACNLGDPLQNGTAGSCHASTAAAPLIASACVAGLVVLVAVVVVLRLRSNRRAERLLLAVGVGFELVVTAPVAVLYAAAWL